MCEIYDGDYEPCQVWSETTVKAARKAHRCDCCGGIVRPGEQYTKHFSVADGHVETGKICAPCLEARREFTQAHGLIGTPRRFEGDLRDCFGEEARPFWTDEDRRWRSLLAGMLRRRRAARRGMRRTA